MLKRSMTCDCSCCAAPTESALPKMAVELLHINVPGVSLGIYPEERRRLQSVVVHLRLDLDVAAVAHHDGVEHTADYAVVVADTLAICTSGHFDLLETLVMAVARQLLERHVTVLNADVTIEKTHAPVAAQVAARWLLSRRHLQAFSPASGA